MKAWQWALIAAAVAVAFVVWRKRPAPAPAVKPGMSLFPRTEEQCRAQGGVWGPANRSARTNTCNFPRF